MVNQYVCLGDLRVCPNVPPSPGLIRGCSGAALGFKSDEIKTTQLPKNLPQSHGFRLL